MSANFAPKSSPLSLGTPVAAPRLGPYTSTVVLFLAILLSPQIGSADGDSLERFQQSQPKLGTLVTVTAYAKNIEAARPAYAAAWRRVEQLDQIFSNYRRDSEIAKLEQAARAMPVSDELWSVLVFSQRLTAHSDGGFDVTVGPLSRLWRTSRRRRQLPDKAALETARSLTGMHALRLDTAGQTATVKEGMKLDFGAVAKGYIADEIVKTLATHGITRCLINAGGDIVAGGPPPGKRGWRIAVDNPRTNDAASGKTPTRTLLLHNQAIATSGDRWQYTQIGDTRYSHIVDPRTGYGVTRRGQVTVLAENGMVADALASAISVLGAERSREMLKHYPSSRAYIVEQQDDDSRHEFFLAGFEEALEESMPSPRELQSKVLHVRNADPREWDSFAEVADATQIEIDFAAQENEQPYTLEIYQEDVKSLWQTRVNDKLIGSLVRDENEMTTYLEIPAGTLDSKGNQLVISTKDTTPDDVRLGRIILHSRPKQQVLSEAKIQVQIRDKNSDELIAGRITIVNKDQGLQTVGTASNETLAVRPGTIYTSSGQALIDLPAGTYQIFAGRGFEYSLDSTKITATENKTSKVELRIVRQVPTSGYVACDTHVHTRTHSGHGDATVQERMITLAGEGIELPIATDHNVQIDHRPFAMEMGVENYFTPVIGNEVTTKVGHFNVFPFSSGEKKPDHRFTTWKELRAEIESPDQPRVIILNHGRDVHAGTRPLGPQLHNAAVGENIAGWEWFPNAMEVVNSAATQTHYRQLLDDWMAILNRGYQVTPVGCSDSHDVARHFVGQGRTYIRVEDDEPGKIDTAQAVRQFIAGKVVVSYGLFVEMTVDGKYRSGDLVPPGTAEAKMRIRVLGPDWVSASRIQIFANGTLAKEISVKSTDRRGGGVLFDREILVPRRAHDQYLTAVVDGPGVDGLYWRMAKPYQQKSSRWEPRVFACSGAVFLDNDGESGWKSARGYAEALFSKHGQDLTMLGVELRRYDSAVACHVAHLCQQADIDMIGNKSTPLRQAASPETRRGFASYVRAWRDTQEAQATKN